MPRENNHFNPFTTPNQSTEGDNHFNPFTTPNQSTEGEENPLI